MKLNVNNIDTQGNIIYVEVSSTIKNKQMKTLMTLFVAVALMAGTSSCGKEDNPPAETSNSSYEFKFLSGPLQGKEYKASGLPREQVISMFTEQSGENVKGILTQISTDNMTVVGTIGLTANNQIRPFSDDDSSGDSQIILSFTDNGSSYIYRSTSGTPTLKNLKIATIGSNGGASLGLTTYELTFENTVFSDEIAAGNNQNVEVRVSGKIIIK